MVQSGEHGGSVAAPVAAHILEQCLAMDQGNYKVELAALTPPTARIPSPPSMRSDYKNTGTLNIAAEEESADTHEPSDAKVQMGRNGAHPDIKADADQRGKVAQERPCRAEYSAAGGQSQFFPTTSSASNPPPQPAPRPTRARPPASALKSPVLSQTLSQSSFP